MPCPQVYDVCDEVYLRLHRFRRQQRLYTRWARLLDIQPPDPATLQFCEVELRRVKVGTCQLIILYIWEITRYKYISSLNISVGNI